jgi:hypothetical protein
LPDINTAGIEAGVNGHFVRNQTDNVNRRHDSDRSEDSETVSASLLCHH